MKSNAIYVIFAANGVMLTRNYGHACHCRDKYFRSPCVIKKYIYLDEAMDEAVDHLWEITSLDRAIPEQLEIGKVYTPNSFPRN